MPIDVKVNERYSSPFAPLELTKSAADELKRLAYVFVASSVRTYEQYLFEANGVVDKAKWKFMYKKDDVRSCAERHSGQTPASSSTTGSTNATSSTTASSDSLPVILVTGTITGELDDTIYGFICLTIDIMRIKTSYVHDTLVRGCVLTTLIKPSTSDPYRSLTIKWMEKGPRAHTRAVISIRDFVYMESTGVEYLKNGERVGYHLVHSVQFLEMPSRESAIRGNMPICAIYREQGPALTECIERVLATKTVEVARDEIAAEGEFHRWQGKYTGSSNSGSSSGPEFTFVDELN